MSATDAKVKLRLESLINNPHLQEYDKGFLESLMDGFKKYDGLTPRQLEALVKIEKRYSPEKIAELEKWTDEYRTKRKEDTKVIAAYYASTQYFRSMAHKILTDDDYIPNRHAWERMTSNPYAKRALAASKTPAKFEVGKLCTVRQNVPYTQRASAYKGQDVMVLESETAGYQYRTCKVCLFLNPSVIFEIEERHLKAPRKYKAYGKGE